MSSTYQPGTSASGMWNSVCFTRTAPPGRKPSGNTDAAVVTSNAR